MSKNIFLRTEPVSEPARLSLPVQVADGPPTASSLGKKGYLVGSDYV